MHTIVWRFTVKPETKATFEQHYGPEGSWAQLFRRAPGYVGTELLRDAVKADVYVTLDHWQSVAAFQAFQAAQGSDYKALDQVCEALTLHEEKLGAFDS